ncbi:unnamed protein product [Trichobilharzia regenti]|nr:unnamed protein product [Trichobilharzia regenti]
MTLKPNHSAVCRFQVVDYSTEGKSVQKLSNLSLKFTDGQATNQNLDGKQNVYENIEMMYQKANDLMHKMLKRRSIQKRQVISQHTSNRHYAKKLNVVKSDGEYCRKK